VASCPPGYAAGPSFAHDPTNRVLRHIKKACVFPVRAVITSL
jgi:hypothetical protein